MEQYLITAGLILNSLLMILNRFWKQISDWLYIPGLVLGIGLILAGAFLKK